MDAFPQRVDGGFLKEHTFYEGGYLKLKASASEYTFTPYIVLNIVMGQRYFDENPIVESIKEANRQMQFGKLEEAETMLRAAQAQFSIPAMISPKEVMQEAGVVPKGKGKGLLDIDTRDLISGAVQLVRGKDPKKVLHSKLQGMGMLGQVTSRLLGGKPSAPKAAPAATPTPGELGVKVERLYTDFEYTFFSDLIIAMNAKLALLHKKSEDSGEVTKALRLFRRAIENSKDLPRSPAECQVFKTSMTDMWDRLVESYGLSPDDEITDGSRMKLVEKLGKKGKLGDMTADEAFEELHKQRQYINRTLKVCLPAGLRAY